MGLPQLDGACWCRSPGNNHLSGTLKRNEGGGTYVGSVQKTGNPFGNPMTTICQTVALYSSSAKQLCLLTVLKVCLQVAVQAFLGHSCVDGLQSSKAQHKQVRE